MDCGDACERCHLDPRWSSLWGHEPCEGVPKCVAGTHANGATGTFGGAPYETTKRVRGVPKQRHADAAMPCEFRHWDLRWSSLWGHETCEGCAETETCGGQRQGWDEGRKGGRGQREE